MAPRPGDVIPVIVEAAMGADLTADPVTWTWTDLSTRLLGQATIVRGRADEAQQTQPSTLTVRLANSDGWLTPRHPSSPWYLMWKRGVPIRLKVTVPGDATYTRMQGRATVIRPIWPSGNSEIAWVDVTVKGSLYSLQQGKPTVESPMRHAITASAPVAYWTMEDTAGQITSALPGGMALTDPAAGTWTYAAASDLPGSSPAPTLTSSTSVYTTVSGAFHSNWQTDWFVKIPAIPVGETIFMRTFTGTGSPVVIWDYVIGNDGNNFQALYGYNTRSQQVVNSGHFAVPPYMVGQWIHLRLMARQNGANVEWQLVVFPVFGSGNFFSGTIAGTVGGVTALHMPAQAGLNGVAMGHLAVHDRWDFSATDAAARGYTGELATTRITRLCAEAGIPVTITGTSTTAMGPQSIDTLDANLRRAEDADVGILTDGSGPGLGYLARPSRYNQAVALALDAARGQVKWPPFAPVEDDQRLRNRFTVARIGGGSATYADPGATTEGVYPGRSDLSLSDDSTLADQASWRVNLLTPEQMRAPVVTIDVRSSPELLSSWPTADIGERYTVANPPVQYPPGGLDLVLEGYTEVIDGITWRVTLTGSPIYPWQVFVLDTDRLDADPSSQLVAGISTSVTTLQVSTAAVAGALWTTDPAEWTAPKALYLNVDGEQMRVTNITGTTSPQTFTVVRSINGVTKTHAAGAYVGLWQPRVLAL